MRIWVEVDIICVIEYNEVSRSSAMFLWQNNALAVKRIRKTNIIVIVSEIFRMFVQWSDLSFCGQIQSQVKRRKLECNGFIFSRELLNRTCVARIFISKNHIWTETTLVLCRIRIWYFRRRCLSNGWTRWIIEFRKISCSIIIIMYSEYLTFLLVQSDDRIYEYIRLKFKVVIHFWKNRSNTQWSV